MTAWYYSDTQRNRLGPVAASDLAQLHENGQLAPEVLVWREGMADWKPWREMMGEVLGTAPAASNRATFAVAGADAPAHASGNPYEIAERASPYAAPTAEVGRAAGIVRGDQVIYARFLKRLAANAVDSVLVGIASYIVLIPLMLAMGTGLGALTGDTGALAAAGLGFIALMYGVQFGLPALYAGWLQSSSWQATLGKRMADVKIVRPDGTPIGFWRGFLRSIAFVLSIMLTCGLGALATAIMTAVTDRRQGLHDLICDTVVVDRHAFTAAANRQTESLNTASVVVLVLYALLIVGVFAAAIVMGILGAAAAGN